MKVTTEELERCEVLMTVAVEPSQEQKMLKKAAKKIAREVQIPGFRPGKAPYNTVVRRFGLEVVQQEALEDSIDKIINDALQESEIQPTAQIGFEGVEWDPLTIKIKVPGQPKVELADFKDIRIEAESVEVSDEDVDESLKRMQEQQATWAPVERPTELNDLVSMSVVEKDGDEILAEHDSVEYELVLPEEPEASDDEDGSDDDSEEDNSAANFQPDLTTPLLGLNAGDEKTFSVTYPEAYNEERYAGKEITFTVNISSVKAKELDPLDDEFAQSVSDFDTLEELKADTRANMEEGRQRQANQELGSKLLDQIVEAAPLIEWPVGMEDEAIDLEARRFTDQFKQIGLTFEDYLSLEKKTEEEFKEQIRESVVEGLKRSLVMAEVAKTEEITVSNSDILEHVKRIADMMGVDDTFWQQMLASESYQNRLANEVLSDKVMVYLAAIAKGEDPKAAIADDDEAEDNAVDATEANDDESTTDDSDAAEAPVEEVSDASEATDAEESAADEKASDDEAKS